MPVTLLPASAAAFRPRSAPNIVLGSRPETWLTQTLKRVNKVKRPLNNVNQHSRCLNELLDGPSALWSLAAIMLPKTPDADLKKDSNPLVEALFNYQMLSIEAYVVHVDMVSAHEIAFKLTQDTIDTLVEYHTDVFSVDTSANTWKWPEKESHLRKLQDEFKQAINKYVYRTDAKALEGLEEDGSGELLQGRSQEVKDAITGFFLPLLPPPPKLVEVVRPQPIYHFAPGHWYYQPVPMMISGPQHLAAPVEAWKVLGSSPSPTATTAETFPSPWSANVDNGNQSLSPASSYGQPYSGGEYYHNSPQLLPSSGPLPLPSAIASQCGPSAAGGWNGFQWYQNDFMPQTPIFT